MKKLLMTLLVAFAFCGSMFAQKPWTGNYNPDVFTSSNFIVAYVQIDGEFVDSSNFGDVEVGAYVINNAGVIEWRGSDIMYDYTDEGDLYPILNSMAVYYDSEDEEVLFQLYNTATSTLYENCSIFYYDDTDTPVEILTGPNYYYDGLYFGTEEALVINFTANETPSTIDLDIIGYENGGGWYFISSPIGNVNIDLVNNMTINTFDLYYFDQNGDDGGNEWINYKPVGANDNPEYTPTFTTLECGKGYLYANNADVTLQFPDNAYIGEGTFPLDYYTDNQMAGMHGWNLMGNPYNATVTVNRPFYKMVDDEYEEHNEGDEIGPMEGVLVKADHEDETVEFSAPDRKASSLTLSLSSNSKVLDRAIVGFNEGKHLPKLQFNQNSSKVYFTMDNEDYAVVRSEGMGEMPVNFKAENNGTYSLTLSSENTEFAYLHLVDNLTGADQDMLANPSYSFEAKTTDYACRFKLVFATGNNDETFAFFSNGSLVINNEGNATLEVVDVTGRILKCENINGCANVNIDAASGVYMVRLVNGDNVKVQKVVK